VSPRHYPSTRATELHVPTWNYVTVQAAGPLTVLEDTTWLRDVVGRLTDRHEAVASQPWSIDSVPSAYLEGQLRAIVGVELRIDRLDAKRKLSQNRDPGDVARGDRRARRGDGPRGDGCARRVGPVTYTPRQRGRNEGRRECVITTGFIYGALETPVTASRGERQRPPVAPAGADSGALPRRPGGGSGPHHAHEGPARVGLGPRLRLRAASRDPGSLASQSSLMDRLSRTARWSSSPPNSLNATVMRSFAAALSSSVRPRTLSIRPR